MSLSSSLFSGISGLTTLGNAMQIIGDNIANVNTVGFKSSSYSFQDLLSQSIATQSGSSQIGRGTSLGDIYSTFQQGSFESTGNTTDLAIGGEGFFMLRDSNSTGEFFTRAGNFYFDRNGFMTNPQGFIVQGWRLNTDGENIGSIGDIQMDTFTSPPEQSDQISIITNLDSDSSSNTDILEDAWDATEDPPIDPLNYEYQTTVKVYDSLGSTHDITVYYDKSDTGWEYIIACNPDEDQRGGFNGTASAGLLARGSIEFSDSGDITNLTMDQCTDPGTWTTLTNTNVNGYYEFTANFLGNNADMNIAFDIGVSSQDNGTTWVNDSISTTQYARSSTTVFQTANGYGAGDLQNIHVDTSGVIIGAYSNGQIIPLYRVALAKFQNNQGLYKVGGNLYRETRESGDPLTNIPGTSGLGNIAPNSLEQSNVDIANEFVKMITNQRGFQANSKIITTVDQMLSETIQMKR
ncbi:MAG TPA: flagellar hook protein FlgE [Desulfobacteraceae bacterium]|nr:flagellar hook protein FlgE [Desulfobacteraceae bacterium]